MAGVEIRHNTGACCCTSQSAVRADGVMEGLIRADGVMEGLIRADGVMEGLIRADGVMEGLIHGTVSRIQLWAPHPQCSCNTPEKKYKKIKE